MNDRASVVSIVTPTYRRPLEVRGLLENLTRQSVIPDEIVIVDGGATDDRATESVVADLAPTLPYRCVYVRRQGGTAIQRNEGIDHAAGDFITFVDDDVRLEPKFLETLLGAFADDERREVGGIVGYRSNIFFPEADAQRWRWYRRLGLLSTFEPGRYDFASGYPININMQPPFSGVRDVDFMSTACAMWRRDVFADGLRFDPFFADYGMLEDAHLSLIAGRRWRLLQSGDARCTELHSEGGRPDQRVVGYKNVVNFHYVFRSVAGPLSARQHLRFWRYQLFECARMLASGVRRRRWSDFDNVLGRTEGMIAVCRGATRSATQCAS